MVVRCFYYGQVFVVRYAMNAPVRPLCWRDRIARPVQNGNWYSRLAQRMCDTKLYITGTNITVTYCCGNNPLLHIVTGL